MTPTNGYPALGNKVCTEWHYKNKAVGCWSGMGILTKFEGANCTCWRGFLYFLENHFPVDDDVDIVAVGMADRFVRVLVRISLRVWGVGAVHWGRAAYKITSRRVDPATTNRGQCRWQKNNSLSIVTIRYFSILKIDLQSSVGYHKLFRQVFKLYILQIFKVSTWF